MSNDYQDLDMDDFDYTGSEGRVPSDPLDFLAPNVPSIVNSRPSNVNLSQAEALELSKQIQDVLNSEPEEEDQVMGEDEEEMEPVPDVEDQQRRTTKLKGALESLARLWWSGNVEMDVVSEKLADASRQPEWRIPLGDSGILNFYLESLKAHSLRHTMKIHTLRLIGNSCADTDENRARVVDANYMPTMILQLKDTSLLPFTIPVLYNICIDYEPAQQQASDSLLARELIELISSPAFNDSKAFLGYTCKILDLLLTQSTEPSNAPENTVLVLFGLAADRNSPCDMEDFVSLVNTAVGYMQHEKFQKALISQRGLDTTLSILVDSYSRFDATNSLGNSPPDQDEAKMLSQMRGNLNQVLSDVSALPEFSKAYPVVSPLTNSLRRWLSSSQLQLQVCACIMLGNLARSKETCVEFVHTAQVHKPLIEILTETSNNQLLHAALGFLKNLAIPPENHEPIGTPTLWSSLPRLWLFDTLPQIQYSSISLARQIVNGTYPNVRAVCARLSTDTDSPAHSRTKLTLLIDLFDRTDAEPTKMEIARLLTAICRTFNTYTFPSPQEAERVRKSFFEKHPDAGRPLGFMVSQSKWPVVRSEGWFVFALMARYPEGAEIVSDMMQDLAVFQPLVQLLTGKDLVEYKSSSSSSASVSPGSASVSTPDASQVGSEQAAEHQRLDRENAMILVSELLKNRGDKMAVMRRTVFEDLLKGGGELVMSYRESKPDWKDTPVPPERRARAGLNLQEVAAESFKEFLS